MIIPNQSKSVQNDLHKQIKIKETQIKIALEANMFSVAEALKLQLSQLQESELQTDFEFQALMSLLDE
jgi:actin-like ATPase involved in cell morphogenesis